MYCDFYQFYRKPFEVTPDPKFLYLNHEFREILAALMYGIGERRGFITILGEVGTGKTTLLNAALEKLDRNTKSAFLFNTDMTFKQMLTSALMELGLVKPNDRLNKMEAIYRLNSFAINQLSKGGNVVIIVDEAQNLTNRSLENFRLLSNLETPTHKLVQIVLSGQPELEFKLNKPELRQLSQRISLKRYVTAFSEIDTYAYIDHRLSLVSSQPREVFSKKAKEFIWSYSRGIPRKINILCDNALLIGFGIGKDQINAEIISETINDLTQSFFWASQTSAVKCQKKDSSRSNDGKNI